MKTSVAHVSRNAQARISTTITFAEGIIGFPECKCYAMMEEKSREPFFWLQAEHDADLSFIVMNPREVKADYAPVLSEIDKRALGVQDESDCDFWAIVSVARDSDQISVNLLAPLAVSKKEKRGRQVILQDQEYEIQYLLLEEMLKQSGDHKQC